MTCGNAIIFVPLSCFNFMIDKSVFFGWFFVPLTSTLSGSQNTCAISNQKELGNAIGKFSRAWRRFEWCFYNAFFMPCSLFDPTRVAKYTKIFIPAGGGGVPPIGKIDLF